MEITYTVIVAVITLAVGAITNTFISSIPNRFIPLQNLIVGLLSAAVCILSGVEPNALQAIVLCVMAAMGAGGAYDLTKIKRKSE